MPTLPFLVEYLKNHIGPENTSYIAGLENVEQLKEISFGVNETIEMRIRHAYDVVRVLSEKYDDRTAKSWLYGINTRLENSPAYTIRHAESLKDLEDVVAIARGF